jgi:EAL domain-containing protein (putative c-di-GMP-specific phosphodiesterase class I)
MLKLEHALVSSAAPDMPTGSRVRTLINLAHSLGIAVIAEGIETSLQRDHMHALGCDYAQGSLFSHPLDAQAAEALLQATRDETCKQRMVGQ